MENNTALLSIRDLSINFRRQDAKASEDFNAVDRLSFDIYPNQTVAIVGESGSGKSVSALSILRLLPESQAYYPSGKILYANQNLLQASEKQMRQIRGGQISMIFQEPMTSLNPLHTIERQISEALLLHKGLTGSTARKRVIELLSLVGISQAENRLNSYPHELSGGQKQRVMIAMALANEPKLLIADEPTTALDVTVQKQVLELINELKSKLNMAVLLITHDLNIVKHYADHVVVMHQGKLVEQNECQALFAQPESDYTHRLLNADPTGQPQSLSNDAPVVLDSKQLNVWFPIKGGVFNRVKDYFKAAKDINIQLRQGETLGIVGESGSGKTTIGLALMKLLASHGDIQLLGHNIQSMNQNEFRPLRKDIQIVFQDPYGSLSPRMSVGQIIQEGLDIHNIGTPEERRNSVIKALQEVGLDPEVRHRYPHEFSGGQRQRIAVARALVLQPKVIIMDEPTSALDRTVQCQVVDLLLDIQAKYNISYIFISHDLAVVKALSHRILVLKDGQVVETGDCQQIFHQPAHPYTRELMEAAFYYEGALQQ